MEKREVSLEYSNSKVIFDKGRFDEWCVYVVTKEKRVAPKDIDYFIFFKELDEKYSHLNVYDAFLKVYENTNKAIEDTTLAIIKEIVDHSGLEEVDKKRYEGYLVVLYLAMIAEENKAYTKLGKRIKRLGMHHHFFDGLSAQKAANYSCGKNWEELDAEMRARGF